MARNNNENNGDRHKIHEIFLINYFVFVITLVLKDNTQFGNDSNYSKFNGENIATNCSVITVHALDGLTKKHFDHYALLKIFPSNRQVPKEVSAVPGAVQQSHYLRQISGERQNNDVAERLLRCAFESILTH